MIELIDRKALIESYCRNSCMKGADSSSVPCAVPCEEVQAMLDAPAIATPNVVRCGECRYYEDGACYEVMEGYGVEKDWFCGSAERMPENASNGTGGKMNTELKPCPFCGGSAKIVFKPKIYTSYREAGVWCRKCKIHVCHRFDNSVSDDSVKKGLAELWNNRAEMVGGMKNMG